MNSPEENKSNFGKYQKAKNTENPHLEDKAMQTNEAQVACQSR